MPPLRSLEAEFPVLDAAFRQFCSARGLFTVEDFLVCDLHALAAAADNEPSFAVLREGIASVLSIIHGQHQPWRNGTELLDGAVQRKRLLATGCHEMDLLLEGGIREGQVTELVGASSSGKTQMCLSIAAHVADRYSGTVMYFDTGNSFSAKRIVSAVVTMLGKDKINEYKLERITNRIFHRSVYDIFSLLEILRELDLELANNKDSRLCLLIVDSISSLVTPILSKNAHGCFVIASVSEGSLFQHKGTVASILKFEAVSVTSNLEGRSLMISTGCFLKKLALEHNISILVTNHMVSGEGGASKPALGESWKTVANVRLLLSREQGSGHCNVSIVKHTLMALALSAKFVIHDGKTCLS